MIAKWRREIVLSVISTLALFLLAQVPGTLGGFAPTVYEVLALPVGAFLGLMWAVWGIRREVIALLDWHKISDRRLRSIQSKFYFPDLKNHLDSRTSLTAAEGVDLDRSELSRLSRICFATFRGSYIGADSNVPTSYYSLYPDYLESQVRGRQASGDARFLLVTAEQLVADHRLDSREFETFFRWHVDNQIRLLQVDPQEARSVAKTYGFSGTDVGSFNWQAALFVEPVGAGPTYHASLKSLGSERR